MAEYQFKDLLPLDEVLEREGYYRDWTHLDPEVFYSLTQISEYIKTKGYGVDVRLLIAQLAEHFGLKSTQIIDLANLLQRKFENLEGVTQSFTNNISSLVTQMEADKNAVIANATVDSEVILARGGKPTLPARLDETDEQLNNLGIQLPDASGVDDTQLIQESIDEAHAQGGGVIIIPSQVYKVSSTIDLKQNVTLRGVSKKSTIEFKQLQEDGLFFDKKSIVENMTLSFEKDYEGRALSFDGANMSKPGGYDFRPGSRAQVRNIDLLSTYNEITTEKTAIALYSNSGGVWFNSFDNIYIFGFNIAVDFFVDTNGWVNGNTFKNINFEYFDTAVRSRKTSTGLEISYNLIDHPIIQGRHTNTTVFDDYASNNIYRNVEIYDLQILNNVNFGFIPNERNRVSQTGNSKEQLLSSLRPDKYIHLGTFAKIGNHGSRYFTIDLYSGDGIDTTIKIRKDLVIERHHRGRLQVESDDLEFYYHIQDDTTNASAIDVYMLASRAQDISVYSGHVNLFSFGSLSAFDLEQIGDVSTFLEDSSFSSSSSGYKETSDGVVNQWGYKETPITEIVATISSNMYIVKGEPLNTEIRTGTVGASFTPRTSNNIISMKIGEATATTITPYYFYVGDAPPVLNSSYVTYYYHLIYKK